MYVYVCEYEYACAMHELAYVKICMYMCFQAYVTYNGVDIFVCVCVYGMHDAMYMYIYIYTYTFTHVHDYIYMSTYSMYIYIRTYIP
jgi:hypothetical protein